ncbi:MORN repeat-containing protein [Desulfitobacterium chlororespirans]|uniref:Uncharacterized conserved protein n=1 Tax=Desulfitobacterium chlororespirans DSM 11544 TaxID=1121395 RepID=A0A1M7TZD3_9FIRM|nr:hypothetical protein [Desulfitobacterium chlororespirans]SHN76106.1 Uncharacterized conserved protein [Desulfitobacterium chlororespirans DSM 11544]
MIIKLLMKYIQIIYRTTRSVVLRPFVLAKHKFSSLTNLSKFLNQIPKAFASLLTKFKLKPEKREDYVDAGPIFIAKSLLVILVVILVATPFLIVTIVWPWVVSLALTAHFYTADPKLEGYKGKVEVFYEEKLEKLKFKGRLEEGKAIGYGEEFYEDGSLKYAGPFVEGRYEGSGEFIIAPGVVYKGEFRNGKRSGQGIILENDILAYAGAFAEDLFEGEGTEYYPDGRIQYKGSFKGGLYSGPGAFQDEKGVKRYEGNFADGLFNGAGRYYDEQGELVYTGSFLNGLYDGQGRLILLPHSTWYEGPFLGGKANGEGVLFKNGMLYYEGAFINDKFSGTGTLTDSQWGLTYSGAFMDNDIAYGKLFDLSVPDLYTAFAKGIREDTADEKYFYLYNQGFGLVLKFSYANEEQEAKLVNVFRRPEQQVKSEPAGQGDKAPAEKGAAGALGTGTIDQRTAGLLGIPSGTMNNHQSLYEGYGLRYWIDPRSEEVLLLEYYPTEKAAEPALKDQEQPVGKSGAGQAGPQYTAYFEDLGLDIADFGSLGYGNQGEGEGS